MDSTKRRLAVAFAAVLIVLLAGGAWFYRAQQQRMRREAEQELQAIAESKVHAITSWRAERLGDAAVLAEDALLVPKAAQWLADPQPDVAEQLRSRFRSLQRHYSYDDVLLVDPAGQVRLSLTGRTGPVHEELMEALRTALVERRCVLSDLHAGPGGEPPDVGTVAPLYGQGEPAGKPIGAVVLRRNANRFLYPIIQSWPTPSASAESLLVRRDGDSLLFLNDLRHRQGAALTLRIPLARKDVPSVMAVEGAQGVAEGNDYRGVRVLATLRAVPDTPWFLVAKVDAAEALAAWREQAFLIVALILGLVAVAAAAAAVVWQRKGKAHYRALFLAEQGRRQAERRHHTTLMSIGDAVISADAHGSVELMNPVAEALTGWRLEEARGKPVTDVFHIINEQTRQPAEDPVARVLREGLVVGLANHASLLSRDGAEHPIADSGAPVLDENGAMAGAVLVFRDQTRERAAQRALQTEKDNLQAIVAAAPVGMLIIDTSVNITYANPAAERIFGQKLAELQRFRCGDVIGCDNRDKDPRGCGHSPGCPDCPLSQSIRSALATGQGVQARKMEAVLDVGQGDVRKWLLFGVVPVVLEGQKHVVVTLGDITDLKRAEEASRESEEHYRTLFEGAQDGIALADAETVILLDCNEGLCRMVERPRVELVGQAQSILHPPDALVDGKSPSFRGHRDGDPGQVAEDCLLSKSGKRIPAEIRAARVRLRGRDCLLGIFRDMTERARMEQELRNAQKMEAIGRLAGGVAHDFRNQLAVIKGYGEMLLRRDLMQDQGRDMMAEILEAVDRSTLLTGQLLVFSRRQPLNVRAVDLTELVVDVSKAVPRMVGEDIRVVVVPSSVRCVVDIDPAHFQQAMLNLVANARDAMPQGGELTIETSGGPLPESVRQRHTGAGPGGYAGVAVRDTGSGMDEATVARLFEPFFTTKEVGQGTGLGLPMVYGFVEQSGGFIDVRSEPGKGSTFTVYFPQSQASADAGAEDDSPAAPPPGGTETILVVEDEDPVRRMLVASLRESGYEVLEASRLAEALRIVNERKATIDMLITDVVMPQGSGIDLAQQVARDRPSAKILFISGYPGDELTRRGVKLDPARILAKPCDHAVLLRKVRDMLDGTAS